MEKTFSVKFKKFLHELRLYSIGIIVLLLLGFYLILFIPTFILRPIARFLRKYLRPDLGDILSTLASMFAQVDTEDSTKTIIVVQNKLSGNVCLENVVNEFQEKVIDCRLDDGNLRYPELKQFITNWMGYKFWKWEDNFDVRNHVHKVHYDKEIKSPEGLRKYCDKMLSKPFAKNLSPWEIHIISGIKEESNEVSQVIIRVHHALADGFSGTFIFQRFLGKTQPKSPIAARLSTKNFSYFVNLPAKILRVFGELVYHSTSSSLWKIPEHLKAKEFFHCQVEKIPVATIKKIKNNYGVSFTSVLYSLVSGGIHNFIVQKKDINLPLSLASATVVPIGGEHPDKLHNRFSFALFSNPVGESDPQKRLKMIHDNFEDLRESPIPLIGYWVSLLHGCHFNFVGRILNSYKYSPLVTTYFPLGVDHWTLDGHDVEESSFYLSFQQGDMGAFFCISSYCDGIRITPVFNASVLSREDVEVLCSLISTEINVLLNGVAHDADTNNKLKSS